jgi:class 3 adenylate cyclase
MSAFITRKKFILALAAGIFAAAGAAALLEFLLSGPRLGPWYDFLLSRRSPPPVSREILLIDSEDIVESAAAAQALITLSEMDAAVLVLETAVLGSSGRMETGEEIRFRFDEEFDLLGRNIRNLFEAIRTGSLGPSESPRYVEELVELAERGKERLSSALVRQDEAGTVFFRAASSAFGSLYTAGDLRGGPSGAPGLSWYARPEPDRDGRLRRIRPVLPGGTAHAAFAAVNAFAAARGRWNGAIIEYAEQGPVLTLGSFDGGEEDRRIPLDGGGALLVEGVAEDRGFRRIDMARILEYGEADRLLLRQLKEAESLGIRGVPERAPVFLYDYALTLRDEFLAAPDRDKRAAWLYARIEYFKSLDELLEGPEEARLVAGYEDLVATEDLSGDGVTRITGLRDGLVGAFARLRESRQGLRELRELLETELASSLCIMGRPDLTASSALLANALLTGSFVSLPLRRHVFFWSLIFTIPGMLLILTLRPPFLFFSGLALGCLAGLGFSWAFILSGYWIDPFIPAAALLAGTAACFFVTHCVIRRGARRFRLAYGPHVGKENLRRLIRAGRPLPGEIIKTRAALVAVKDPSLIRLEDRSDPADSILAIRNFREQAALLLKNAGGCVLGGEGDTVTACFGSPLEQSGVSAGPGRRFPAGTAGLDAPPARAGAFVMELPEKPEFASWRFGIDEGDCAFFWTPLSGYTAAGRPVVRARILAGLTRRYGAKVLISNSVREKIRMPVRKLHTLKEKDGGGGETFYELMTKN